MYSMYFLLFVCLFVCLFGGLYLKNEFIYLEVISSNFILTEKYFLSIILSELRARANCSTILSLQWFKVSHSTI